MDDALEQPKPADKAPRDNAEEQDEEGEDEDGPDWSNIPLPGRAFIPKRGEKEYEPRAASGTSLQQHLLERSRNAMFDAISGVRGANHKSISHGIWIPSIARAHVTIARGSHFTTIGTSVSRDPPPAPKRLELLPEEALYLIERGSMFCWKRTSSDMGSELAGIPMSVQQAYAEMIGQADTTLDHYQVYAYLKRLGYNVLRTRPVPPPALPRWWRRLLNPVCSLVGRLAGLVYSIGTFFLPKRDWWRPLLLQQWGLPRDYSRLFERLRIIPSGHSLALHTAHLRKNLLKDSPYRIFFDVYKPGHIFRKSERPPPDYQVAVVNGRTTPMPTIHELTALFDTAGDWRVTQKGKQAPPSTIPRRWWQIGLLRGVEKAVPQRQTNPFVALRAGTKSVVIAVVDAGTITCYRFNRGAFEVLPMV
ncbi:hypothetical protein AURDEDRAFT_78886 [Auricularia subglabra TFB-10046 SS5]|nr:hypothetical protein AURDEDRAFT_78886 [Auricularia subglabra TFB-10046 SS5]